MATKKKPRKKAPAGLGVGSKAKLQGGFVSTAYGPPWGGINGEGEATACGVKIAGGAPTAHAVAAGANYPCGTILLIKPNPHGSGAKPYVVWDRGGAIGSKNIDFYLPTRTAQMKWGRRNVAVADTGKQIDLPTDPDDVDRAVAKGLAGWGGAPFGLDADTVQGAIDDINPIDDVAGAIAAIAKFIARLFEPEFWVRVGKVVLGVGAVAFGVVILARAILGVDIPGPVGRAARGGRRRGGRDERPLRGRSGREVDSQRKAVKKDRGLVRVEKNRGYQAPPEADKPPF